MDESGGEWKGKAFMCTRDREFRIEGRQDCFVRGYDRTGFFEVDTGKDAKNWTVQLTDPAKPGPAALTVRDRADDSGRTQRPRGPTAAVRRGPSATTRGSPGRQPNEGGRA